MSSYDLFMPLNGELAPADIEQIIQSLVTYGDKIWLPVDYAFAPSIDPDAVMAFGRLLRDLEDAHLLRLWTLEGMGSKLERRAALVIDRENQDDLAGC